MATTDVAQQSRLANARDNIRAYKLCRLSHPGKDFALIFEWGLLIMPVMTVLFVKLDGLSVQTFWHNALLMTGWPIWIGFALLVRYEVKRVRRKWSHYGT